METRIRPGCIERVFQTVLSGGIYEYRTKAQQRSRALILALLIVSFPFPVRSAEEPLIFVNLPDIHCADLFLESPAPAEALAKLDALLEGVKAVSPAFVMIPGDLGAQHWYGSYPDRTRCPPTGSLRERIDGCANIAYSALKARMASHGLPIVHVAVGDHELGDNDWPLGLRSEAVPIFREAFVRHFTRNPDGSPRYGGSLGGVPLRPIGTPYEWTSYAFTAGWALFVAVDEFRQDNPELVLGPRGTVTVSVDQDGHLQWLDRLLAAARQDANIRKIIVFGHAPVLHPVRALASSAIYVELGEASRFWRTLRRHRVDLYLAGEVHATTVIKDPRSRLFQLVDSAGYGENSFSVLKVYSNRIVIEKHRRQDGANGTGFVPIGKFVIKRTADGFGYWASGRAAMKPIDPAGLVVHYPFDGAVHELGVNHGSFGTIYNAAAFAVTQVPGVSVGAIQLGKGAAFADINGSKLESLCVTPISGDQARTIGVWLKTSHDSPGAYIYPSGLLWNRNGGFRVFVANGLLGLEIDRQVRVVADQGARRLNDGLWHHVALTFPGPGSVIADARFFIDGIEFVAYTPVNETIRTETSTNRLNVGGRAKNSAFEGWTGAMDDFAIWASALSAPMVSAINSCAMSLAYDATDMEALFKLFRLKRGNASVEGRVWEYKNGIKGSVGVCEKDEESGQYRLILDIGGKGLMTTGLP